MGHLVWSKNVNEEKDAPQQIMFGAMDVHYDILSPLGLWLQYQFEQYCDENEYILYELEDPKHIKDMIRQILDHILCDDAFHHWRPWLHEHPQHLPFAVTFAHGQGCNKVGHC